MCTPDLITTPAIIRLTTTQAITRLTSTVAITGLTPTAGITAPVITVVVATITTADTDRITAVAITVGAINQPVNR